MEIQVCIVHQIRNPLKYIGPKYQKDLILVYKSVSLEAAESALDELASKWGEKYPVLINSWVNNWGRLSTYFRYSGPPIRRLIYTTNIIEGLQTGR